MQNQNLELHFLHQVSACLNLCRAHPLFEKLLPHAQTFDYRLLEAYPYVEYQKLPTRTDCYTTISTADQYMERLPGEDLFSGRTPADRAAEKLIEEYNQLNDMTTRREEWMAAQTMINNGCDMVEYIDDVTQGDTKQVRFFTGEKSDHLYTVAKKWNETGGDYRSDVRNMCRMLSARGLPAADLILGYSELRRLHAHRVQR